MAVATDSVTIHFARRPIQRLHFWRCAFGQVGIGEHVVDLLAGKLRIGMVFKDDGNDAEAEKRGGADICLLLHRVHRDFDGNGDEFLDFFRRSPLPLRDDSHFRVCNIRKGVHRCVNETNYPDDSK